MSHNTYFTTLYLSLKPELTPVSAATPVAASPASVTDFLISKFPLSLFLFIFKRYHYRRLAIIDTTNIIFYLPSTPELNPNKTRIGIERKIKDFPSFNRGSTVKSLL